MSWCSHSTSVNQACCLLNWTIVLSCENMSCLDIAEYTCCICVFARGECLAIRSNHSTAGWWIRCPVSITNGRNLVVDWSSAAMSSPVVIFIYVFTDFLRVTWLVQRQQTTLFTAAGGGEWRWWGRVSRWMMRCTLSLLSALMALLCLSGPMAIM